MRNVKEATSRVTSIRISVSSYEALRRMAFDTRRSMNKIIAEFIHAGLNRSKS